MGLSFPAGAELEKAALESRKTFKPKPCVKGTDCCLSGIENKCLDMIKSGESKCDVALFCLDSVAAALEKMTENILKKYGRLPLVFAGGVMSNSINTPKVYGGVRRILCRARILCGQCRGNGVSDLSQGAKKCLKPSA